MDAVEYLPPMRPITDSLRLRSGQLRVSGRLWPVLGLTLVVGACSSGPPPATYDLSAPSARVRSTLPVQVLVAEPAAVQILSGQQIIVKDAGGSISTLGGAQWAASLPSLVQARLIHTFENAAQIRAVARPSSGATGDLTLTSEIRSFEIATPQAQAVVQISVRMLSGNGRIVAGRIFAFRDISGTGSVGPQLKPVFQTFTKYSFATAERGVSRKNFFASFCAFGDFPSASPNTPSTWGKTVQTAAK